MSDVIAAIATALGPGGLGVIRLSGAGAIACVAPLFHPKDGAALAAGPARQLRYGTLCDREGAVLDTCMAVIFHAGASYTGEESVELHCHGSPLLLSLVLEELFARGARAATAGEFTKRAFLSGKLDLMQAEAVIDLIEAESPAAARQAAAQLGGALSRRVESLYATLVDLLAHFFAVLDYPDEDIDPFRRETIETALQEATEGCAALLASYQRGRQRKNGIACTLLGRPNVGKSSLLNLLAGYERAIVTSHAGTTRDTLEERVNLGGLTLRLCDTAGLRESEDEIERLGVARSYAAARAAELCLLLLDGSAPLSAQDEEALALAKTVPARIALLNKADRPLVLQPADFAADFAAVLPISAKEGSGLAALEEALALLFPQGQGQESHALLTSARQYEAALRAQEALARATQGLEESLPPDLLLLDVEEALAALGELDGRSLREDVTSRIFARFCVGK